MICGLVLAAGRSTRMGTQKLLLPLGDKTVIAHVVDVVCQASVGQTIVVIGADGERLREALAGRPVSFVVNPDPAGDMLSSVRSGLRALPSGCQGVLAALGDHPSLRGTWIQPMIRGFQEQGGGIVVPVHQGNRGHPILFSTEFSEEILSRYDGEGLRGLLEAHADRVMELEIASPEVLEDMDTPEDYRRQCSRFGGP